MDLHEAFGFHGKILKTLDGTVPAEKQGSFVIGMAVALELVRTKPGKAAQLRDVLVTMRDRTIGDDYLWSDMARDIADVLP